MPSQMLSLSQSQQLQMVLAPQLRQSLEMLQLPILELRAMIQQEIEQNPTIEELPTEKESVEIEPGTGEEQEKHELEFEKEFEVLAQLDDEWRDYFFQNLQGQPYSSDAAEKRQFLMDSIPQRESLQEHLIGQLNLCGLSEQDRQTGELLVGSINDDGYLASSLEELSLSTGIAVSQLEGVLDIIRDFDPTGVGACNLTECLMAQLERLDMRDSVAARIVRDHLPKLGARKYQVLARILKVSLQEVRAAATVISGLEPKPGQRYSADLPNYVLPEVIVQKVDGEYVIILDDDQLPHVRLSRHYRTLMANKDTKPEVRAYIRERVRSGAFLIKSIHQRQKTIYRVAQEIVTTQKSFLDNGVAHLKPLTMAEVAEILEVHETTVSRAVSGKYMKTPRGVFDMKYFFTPGIKTADGGQVSNKMVKDLIATLVGNEDPAKPLSDQEIMQKVREEGITIARRTVAKYRLVLRIPPSHLRKEI